MLVPSRAQLLEVWERGRGQVAVRKAITLLQASCPEATAGELFALAIGERDARLLKMRERMFGPRLDGVATCPECGTQLELTLDTRQLVPEESKPAPRIALRAGDHDFQLRLIDSTDLMEAAEAENAEAARRTLCERCVVEANRNGARVNPRDLPDAMMAELGAALSGADTCAELLMQLRCESCTHAWAAPLDVVSFLWTEVDHLARTLLREVHTLAWAYGWREGDILAMSDSRRRFYIEAVGG